MHRKILWVTLVVGLPLLVGCTGGELPVETGQLQSPVNQVTTTIVKQESQDAASDALGRIGVPAVPALSEALTDPDPAVRLEACRALAYMGAKAKDAVPVLTQTLNDHEEVVRNEAARALGQIGETAQLAIPELMRMLHGKK
jgi:HEAT repeat protein